MLHLIPTYLNAFLLQSSLFTLAVRFACIGLVDLEYNRVQLLKISVKFTEFKYARVLKGGVPVRIIELPIFSHLPIDIYARKSILSVPNEHRRRLRAYGQVMQLHMLCIH